MGTVVPPSSCKVYTPLELAIAMVRAVYMKRRQKWLEPSCGKGSFIEAIASLGVDRQDIVGIDLDKRNANADEKGVVLRGVDFLKWSENELATYECAIGNPPYLSIRSLPKSLRIIASSVCDFDDEPVGLRANTWYPFLIRSIRLLKAGGNLAFVLPAASEFADYATIGRRKLTNLFSRVDVIRSRTPLFPGVSEGVVVLIARGKGEQGGLFRRHVVDGLKEVITVISELDVKRARICKPSTCHDNSIKTLPFKSLVDLRIGAVTGDSEYFVLSEKQRVEHGLPISSLTPILSRSCHIKSYCHTHATWEKLKDSNERVWLFYPNEQARNNENVQRYLTLKEDEGGCRRDRYKIRSRSPWYLTPLPPQSHLFLSGMSGQGLWCCVNEFPRLTATNTLYVGTFKEVMSLNRMYAWALTMLTSTVQKQIKREKRVYADGLEKMEPSQVGSLELPIPPQINNARSVYRKVIGLLMDGKREYAAATADSFIFPE